MGKLIEFGEKQEGEVSVWSVATGNIPFFKTRAVKEALNIIQEQDGFIGYYPMRPYGTLCLFKTLNDAKGAKNMMKFHGIECGDNICEIFIDKRYVDGS